MDTLRNLPTDAPANLASLIDIREGRVVSMSLSKSDTCQIMLMAFGSGESVSEEIYFGDTLYTVLEGEMPLFIGNAKYLLKTGDSLMIPSGTSHAIGGAGGFKLLQMTLQKQIYTFKAFYPRRIIQWN